ncbi:MAG: hypothetical protein ACO35I_08805 [Burkholderiaceae bacterium]
MSNLEVLAFSGKPSHTRAHEAMLTNAHRKADKGGELIIVEVWVDVPHKVLCAVNIKFWVSVLPDDFAAMLV